MSPAALHRLQSLVGATLARLGPGRDVAEHVDGRLRCRVERRDGDTLRVSTEEGTLRFADLAVSVEHVREETG